MQAEKSDNCVLAIAKDDCQKRRGAGDRQAAGARAKADVAANEEMKKVTSKSPTPQVQRIRQGKAAQRCGLRATRRIFLTNQPTRVCVNGKLTQARSVALQQRAVYPSGQRANAS